ncbi:MAG: C1 family peptidase [Planctomycetota bacterium]
MAKKAKKTAGKAKPKAARAGRSAGSPRLTAATVARMQEDFQSKPLYGVMQNAITQISVKDMAYRHEVVKDTDHTFSIKLDKWGVTNQMGSGRCWMFAALNLFRVGAMKKLKVDSFEFSQNYPLFWDKMEKANYFLEAIIETAGRDVDDRTVRHLIGRPIDDGGQWTMFISLVKKHGLVPKKVMPETESSSSTGEMNRLLIDRLRVGAKALRDLAADGASMAELRAAKGDILIAVHRILSIHLGTPPSRFNWQWTDRAGKVHRQRNMTPQKFADQYVTVPLDEYVCLVHDPRKTSPIGRTFTVEYLGNVAGAEKVVYLNIDVELMKKIALRGLQDGEPVWFGCDVGQQVHSAKGLWDAEMRDFEGIYDTQFGLDKASRLEYGMTAMTHAMLFTGVDIVGGKPRAWRVENSWGGDKGDSGFYRMNDSWFNEHMFEIAARVKYLPTKLREAMKRKPIVLPAWDPMGSLARETAMPTGE